MGKNGDKAESEGYPQAIDGRGIGRMSASEVLWNISGGGWSDQKRAGITNLETTN